MSEENFSKLPFRVSLLGDTALLSFAEAIAIAVGLVSQVILTRGLSAEEFGTWIVIFDVGLTLFLLADPGLSTVIGRELPSNPQLSSPFLFSIMKSPEKLRGRARRELGQMAQYTQLHIQQ